MLKREMYLKRIRGFYHTELIKILIGMRSSGKTVVLHQIIDELIESGIDKDRIIYINMEDSKNKDLRVGRYLHQYVKNKVNKEEKYYLFFDEIGLVSDFERIINSLNVTLNVSVFVTGSSKSLLDNDESTYLSGRYVSFKIYPFTFKEYIDLIKKDYKYIDDKDLFSYLVNGASPQIHLYSNEYEVENTLKNTFNSVIVESILNKKGTLDTKLLNKLLSYMSNTVGKTFSPQEFMNENKNLSKETIYKYLDYIYDSQLVKRCRRYNTKNGWVYAKFDKHYISDMGLTKIYNTNPRPDLASLLENAIYNELLARGYEVYVGKNNTKEIDFVAVKYNEKAYFQVAYYLYDQNVIDREFGAFKGIDDNYPKYVISLDKWDFSRDGIIHKNAIDFLLDK